MNQRGLAPVLIVLLIALGVGGYFVYQSQAKVSPSQQATQPSPTSLDETKDWKTYTGSTYSFKYPGNLVYTSLGFDENGNFTQIADSPSFFNSEQKVNERNNCVGKKLGTLEKACTRELFQVRKWDPKFPRVKEMERSIGYEEEHIERDLFTLYTDPAGRKWKIVGPVYSLLQTHTEVEVSINDTKHWFDISISDRFIDPNDSSMGEQVSFIKKILSTVQFSAQDNREYLEFNGRRLLIERVGEEQYCEGRVGSTQTTYPKCEAGLTCQFREGTAQDAPGTCVKE